MRREPDADPIRDLRAVVDRAIQEHVPPAAAMLVALSGGRDSVALFDALVATAAAARRPLTAAHVHHGLSPNAELWAGFCTGLCAAHQVPLDVCRVDIARLPQRSLEASARAARYAALSTAAAKHGIAYVLLAHHRDDQAETVLLQLLRGAGPRGLAAMPPVARDAAGVTWLRPLLDVTRDTIDRYAEAAGLRFVDDESNSVLAHRRNAVRHQVMPALAAVFPRPGQTLARAARMQADAARLADDLAVIDAGEPAADGSLDRLQLAALPLHRAANVLRWLLRQHGLPAPSSARLDAMLRQMRHARDDARIRIVHAGRAVGVHRGRVFVHALPPALYALSWFGEAEVRLPHGRMTLVPQTGHGIDLAHVASAPLRIVSRRGGERMRIGIDRPRQALKTLLQEAGIPVWRREALPLVFCGATLAWVPGIGVATGYATPPAGSGLAIAWHPDDEAAPGTVPDAIG
ncbi:MAG: tRNA lysidine(34) synthetase TilS [Casimicrobiaceae bacterium]